MARGAALWAGLAAERLLAWFWVFPVGALMAMAIFGGALTGARVIAFHCGAKGREFSRELGREMGVAVPSYKLWKKMSAAQRTVFVLAGVGEAVSLYQVSIWLGLILAGALRSQPRLAPFARAAGWNPAMLVWVCGRKRSERFQVGPDDLSAMAPFASDWERAAGRFCIVRGAPLSKGLSAKESIAESVKSIMQQPTGWVAGWDEKKARAREFLEAMDRLSERARLSEAIGEREMAPAGRSRGRL